MFKRVFELLEKEVSGETAFNFLSEISRFHRVQASPGIRAAIHYTVDTLKGYGLDAAVHDYAADGKTYSWSCHHFKEWSCRDAELRIVEPAEEAGPLSLWSETKLSLIERCHPTTGGCCEAEVVVLDNGEEEADYKKVDVEGKIVVTNGDVGRVYDLAIIRRGAIGIIYDGMRLYPPVRREGDLDDALQRGRSGGWTGDDVPCFGFVLTPREGRRLRKLVKAQGRKRDHVKVLASVDSQFYEGKIEDAVASIPGEVEDEEVTLVAHIDHPQGYANDNASGCGAVMESARALNRLIRMGDLPRPRRTIRFTLVPEMGGSFAWLAANEDRLSGMVAAVNLDMVGENQDLCGGPFTVIKTPEALPSYVNTFMEAILDEVKHEGKNIAGIDVPLHKYTVSPFSAGSDHYIYSDPTVGIPCPMLIQWPDRFYHTSWDTLDKVDPEMLGKASLIAATYAYFIANAGVEEAIWLASEVATRLKQRISETVQSVVTETLNGAEETEDPTKLIAEALAHLWRKVDYHLERGFEAIKSVRRLIGRDTRYFEFDEKLICDVKDYAKKERRSAERTIAEYVRAKGLKPIKMAGRSRLRKFEKKAAGIVPRRIYRGPVSVTSYSHRPWPMKLQPADRDALWRLGKDHRDSRILGTLALYWVNGERSLLEISRLLELERGKTDLKYLVDYFSLLRKMGLLEFA